MALSSDPFYLAPRPRLGASLGIWDVRPPVVVPAGGVETWRTALGVRINSFPGQSGNIKTELSVSYNLSPWYL